MSKRFLLTLVAVSLALVGIFWVTRDKASAPDPNSSGIVQASTHVQGVGHKGVVLIEYGDFQCPACGSYYPLLKEIKRKYGDDITFQFRNFPLDQIHPNARAAHRAAEAAAKQNKFWEMHDLLYERQQAWSGSTNVTRIFEDYATELGLNLDQYRQDFNSPATNSIINADFKEGQAVGANSTPTFVLDGKKIEQLPRDLEAFYKLIDDAIAAKNPSSAQPNPTQ